MLTRSSTDPDRDALRRRPAVGAAFQGPARTGTHRVWMRANGRLPDDPLVHVCALTFASDMTLLDSVLVRHGLAVGLDPVSMASLDHAMWFHRPFRADEWFLYSRNRRPPRAVAGWPRARFYARTGATSSASCRKGMIRVAELLGGHDRAV